MAFTMVSVFSGREAKVHPGATQVSALIQHLERVREGVCMKHPPVRVSDFLWRVREGFPRRGSELTDPQEISD
jgi:hypothetical protein